MQPRASERSVDVLGPPYLAEVIELPDDDEGRVVATLVHRPAETPAAGRAVLHVHGFCDYFFQTVVADFWVARGYDFYALDLRKYGRSLLPHQTPNFVLDLAAHYTELDEAFHRITARDAHDTVVVTGHSTGGLITALWLDARRHDVAGLVLNSPWLDLDGSTLLRTVGTSLIDSLGRLQPRRRIPRAVTGFYGRSLHRSHDGEWDYNLEWKPLESFPVYAGWLRAIRRGQAHLHRGLHVGAPVLMLTSAGWARAAAWDESVTMNDVVLDVRLMWRWAHALGEEVTTVRIPGGLHDLTLSAEPVRRRVFEELGRWLAVHVEHGSPRP